MRSDAYDIHPDTPDWPIHRRMNRNGENVVKWKGEVILMRVKVMP